MGEGIHSQDGQFLNEAIDFKFYVIGIMLGSSPPSPYHPYADLRGADLRGANLRGADLMWANLNGTDLTLTVMPDGSINP